MVVKPGELLRESDTLMVQGQVIVLSSLELKSQSSRCMFHNRCRYGDRHLPYFSYLVWVEEPDEEPSLRDYQSSTAYPESTV